MKSQGIVRWPSFCGWPVMMVLVAMAITGCGGGGSASSGGGGNGGGNGGGSGGGGGGNANAPTISLISPSKIMVGVPLGSLNVIGTNFTQQAQVYIDGSPSQQTIFTSATDLEAQITIAMDSVAGVHQVTVQQGSETSNSVTFTVYAPVQGPQPFAANSGFFPNDQNSNLLTVADVNGDGFADVVMAGPPINGGANNGESLAVMFGQANGQLGPVVITPGLYTGAMTAGDINGDGTIDIVSGALNSSNAAIISVLLNDGKGNFTQSSTIAYPGQGAASLELVDVDGDGKPDLLFTAIGTDALYYLRNEGGGSFAAPVAIAVTSADNLNFCVADFTGDGRPDIVYTFANPSSGQDQIHLLVNQGGGKFTDQVAAGISLSGNIVIGDFNRDGFQDIAIEPFTPQSGPSTAAVTVFFGQGNGTFTTGPTTTIEVDPFQAYTLIAGDFDGDGNLDLAGVNGDTEPGHVTFLWGDGTGNFTAQAVNGPMGFLLTSGDINGDGVTDVIVPDRFGNLSVVLGQKQRNIPSGISFEPSVGGDLSVGSVESPAELDILSSGSPPSPGNLYLNQGNGAFELGGAPPGQGFLLADLNGDGLADLIGSDGTNLLIWPGTGDPSFGGSPVTIEPPANAEFVFSALQVADMDGDGRLDIVMPNLVLFNNGNFSFTAVQVNFVDTDSPFVIGDFNNDGLLDIASGNATLLGQPGRTFRTVTPDGLNMVSGEYAVVGDFNQDGNLDIVTSGNEDGVVVYYGNGDGTFYMQSQLNVGPISDFSQALAVGDFNGDGRADILACLFLSEQCVVFTNDGQGGFERAYFASGTNATAVLTAKLDGSKPDVLITNYLLDFRPPNFDLILHH